jgi:energy-coupling factor transporter transmembrane protein EcfT
MIPSFLLQKESSGTIESKSNRKPYFIDKTAKSMASFVVASFQHWESSQIDGFLQKLDARVKVIFTLSFILLISTLHSLTAQFAASGIIFIFLVISKSNLVSAYKKSLVMTFVLGFLVFIPASLNLFSKGTVVFPIFHFKQPHQWLIYSIPVEIGFTREGLILVTRLCFKVFNSVNLTIILINTTSFERIIKAFRALRVPEIFILTLTLSYKFIFIFSQTILKSYNALKMRWWNQGQTNETEAILAGRMGYLFRKSHDKYEIIYHSMLARGYSGEVKLIYAEKLLLRDYLFIFAVALVFACIIFINNTYA